MCARKRPSAPSAGRCSRPRWRPSGARARCTSSSPGRGSRCWQIKRPRKGRPSSGTEPCVPPTARYVRPMKLNVLLLEGIHSVAEAALIEAGHNVRRIGGALKEDQLIEQLEGVHFLGIRSKTNVTKRVLDAPQAKSLLAVGAFCIGTN